MINVCNMQQRLHTYMEKLSKTQKEFQILNRLEINITGIE